MKILHTSDIHIREYEDESWKTFESLVKIGAEENIDVFVISGDFFDKKVSFVKLYSEIRPLLNSVEYEFVIIPGNHDENAFAVDAFLGEKVKVIRKLTEPFEYRDVRFFGFPFTNITSEQVRRNLRKVKDLADDNKTNILLFHGELLDHSFAGSDFGDEESNYMGLRLSFLNNLNISYVLAGHFHTNFQAYEFDSGGYFVYPGSPVSITRKETGKRAVNVFKVSEVPTPYYIDTPYYEQVRLSVYPDEDQGKIIERIKAKIGGFSNQAKILVSLTGYTKEEEKDFHKNVKELEYEFRNLEIRDRVKGIKSLYDDELFTAFIEKLEKLKHTRQRAIKKLLIRSILESEE
jgi:DNA repair exonuclease SbcCD nuclease subunit